MQQPRTFSPASLAQIKVKNRRKRYLELHSEYFNSPSLELADPLAYDRLVRRFQTAAEREDEGRKKGYSGTLEADLWRSEAKVEALKHPDENAQYRYRRSEKGQILAEERDDIPTSKEEGLQRWRAEMESRFVRGNDRDFRYEDVDTNDIFDDEATLEREREEEWFMEEEPSLVEGGKVTGGETGIQDF